MDIDWLSADYQQSDGSGRIIYWYSGWLHGRFNLYRDRTGTSDKGLFVGRRRSFVWEAPEESWGEEKGEWNISYTE